jgi:hypothetical protein
VPVTGDTTGTTSAEELIDSDQLIVVPAGSGLINSERVRMAEVLMGTSTVISGGVTINCGASPKATARVVVDAPTALMVNTKISSVPANTITRRFIGSLLTVLADWAEPG